ncbi:MAG: hypothetical protein DWQ04_18445 [Chloroflexi bacterium]|nr:MAG: hypothetical protein DWQ04_18445 [Chloroflexota bacterium]
MKGDFSRDTFNPENQFTRVLMQQGRVQLDADFNEQVSILLHHLRVMAADLIGPHGAPSSAPDGFKIWLEEGVLKIGAGRYYVDGLLCENHNVTTYSSQPNCSNVAELPQPPYLVYLDVWERHVTHDETDIPIREVALGGADTATRAKLVWQVKTLKVDVELEPEAFCRNWLKDMRKKQELRGLMMAQHADTAAEKDACTISPDAAYRGQENQLYRVEIHDGPEGTLKGTFKFSRENGAVIFPLAQEVSGAQIFLKHLGKDGRLSLKKGDWVEVVDDDTALSSDKPHPLLEVKDIFPMENKVKLSKKPFAGDDLNKHPILRRWDQQDGIPEKGEVDLTDCGDVIEIKMENGKYALLGLEKGIQVQFQLDEDSEFKPGDYWLIPARTATGKIEWPQKDGKPIYQPPRGVRHHYAPLAIVDGNDDEPHSCRCLFDPLCQIQPVMDAHMEKYLAAPEPGE